MGGTLALWQAHMNPYFTLLYTTSSAVIPSSWLHLGLTRLFMWELIYQLGALNMNGCSYHGY